ncbi:MAG: hypothetical protein ACOX51_08275 [Myxococcota bacterium]|jgi:hypothetical protein|nr:hypothetical protein [Myxococcota bacterium]HHW96889.1 hypothetical protein [Oligoflexales bacterium]
MNSISHFLCLQGVLGQSTPAKAAVILRPINAQVKHDFGKFRQRFWTRLGIHVLVVVGVMASRMQRYIITERGKKLLENHRT